MNPKQKQKRLQEIRDNYFSKVHAITDTYQQKVRAILKAMDRERLERLRKDLAA